MSRVIIVRATEQDVATIVDVHIAAFPDFFLTLLGARFLRRFYAAVIRHPDALSLVARDENRVIGFAVGPMEPSGFFRKLLLREGVGFCVDSLPALLRSPRVVARRLLRGATYRGEVPDLTGRAALISSIAVIPDAAGGGVGAQLIDAFCEAAAANGADSVYLVTDRDYNPAVNRFYRKTGFVLDCEVSRSDGRPMNRFVRNLRRSDS